jgi:sigma-B regulation protein RsbU (phosphoserine phosphatase)
VTDRLQMDAGKAGQVKLAVEEAVVNVMHYAYPPEMEGEIKVCAEANNERLKLTISDSGVAFDPTETLTADTTLSVEERPIGGLGIFLVRQLMDSINYERIEGRNVLTLRKSLT